MARQTIRQQERHLVAGLCAVRGADVKAAVSCRGHARAVQEGFAWSLPQDIGQLLESAALGGTGDGLGAAELAAFLRTDTLHGHCPGASGLVFPRSAYGDK